MKRHTLAKNKSPKRLKQKLSEVGVETRRDRIQEEKVRNHSKIIPIEITI